MMKKRHLIVDGSNLLHRILHVPTMRELRDKKGRFTGGTYGVLKSVRMTCEQFDINGACIVVWDTGHSPRRISLLPEYKKTRKEKKVESMDDGTLFDYQSQFIKQRATANAGLGLLGVRIALLPDREADDIIAKLIGMLKSEIIIATEDKDFYQLISDRVKVWRPMLGKLMDKETFREDYEFSPRLWTFYRAMTGDASDGIAGVHGVGETTAKAVVQKMARPDYGSLMTAISVLSDSNKRVAKLVGEEEVLRRNLELIDLKRERFDWTEMRRLNTMIVGRTDPDLVKFADWSAKFDLQSILDYLVQWIETFRRLGGVDASSMA